MTSSGRSIPTEDRISDLPDSILCHILSFLTTKHAATTSLVSKRWKPMWLSVMALDFDDENFKDYQSFRKVVHSIMFSLRSNKLPIHSFTFKCGNSSYSFKPKKLNQIFKFEMMREIKNLNLDMSKRPRHIMLPPCILCFKKLEILKLSNIVIRVFDQVDFPCVKILHLNDVNFASGEQILKFLLACPNLEDLETYTDAYKNAKNAKNIRLRAFPNLVKARICDKYTPMSLVCKARILQLEKADLTTWTKELPVFHNLTHLKLIPSMARDRGCRTCRSLLGILSYLPKLQHFHIQDCAVINRICKCWKDTPTIVPECLSSRLKTFYLGGYRDIKCYFEFAKYIIQHSKVLETMTFKSSFVAENRMLLKLSKCKRGSTTCKLLTSKKFKFLSNQTKC